jgi:hypothetical protein
MMKANPNKRDHAGQRNRGIEIKERDCERSGASDTIGLESDQKGLVVGNSEETIRHGLTRREMVEKLLAGIAAGTAWPLIASSHPIHRHLMDAALLDRAEAAQNAASWQPLFLNQQQNESLVALSESIVPGSARAHVNRFIDLLLSVDTTESREKFIASIAALENIAQKHFKHAFHQLNASNKNLVLTRASTEGEHHGDFSHLKDWITTAYYSSEEGMRELGWNGNHAFRTFPGCEPESH